ncbi:MAG: 2TM domain-containing protein [Spirosomaceae bacterium]|jgi:hypothetical protein|nr:2TM domain-containing protein [Spirosomataceae bacterium]
METQRNPELWKIAKKRAAFKSHLYVYLLVNCLLWSLWGLGLYTQHGTRYPWPIWTTLGWGIGLASHFIGTYFYNGKSAVEREYEKLVRQQ